MIINGKNIAEKVNKDSQNEILQLEKLGINLTLAVIMIGENEASKTYVKNKKNKCQEMGIKFKGYLLDDDISQNEVIDIIKKLNSDKDITGILVQLPLPLHLDASYICEKINPLKDVDAFTELNSGKLFKNKADLIPCTPKGIMEMFKYEDIELKGKNCVIIGRSDIVGKPLALLLLQKNATVTVCHSHTKNLNFICQNADVIILAVGKSKLLTSDMISNNPIVIDVGINRDKTGKLCGDADFENINNLCSYISPVPGGVGPLTISMLVKNIILAGKIQNNIN